MTPWETSTIAAITDSGASTYRIVRTRSCQKLPRLLPLRPMIPRTSATATTMPTPADSQFWTVSPIIWLR